MLERLDDYDWHEAFGAAGKEKNTVLNGTPVVVQFTKEVPTTPFDREDVAEIIAISDGENDSENWLGVFLLKDGRYALIDAGCDYTGWGCQEWGTAEVCGSLDEMIRFGLSNEQRNRLGLTLKELDTTVEDKLSTSWTPEIERVLGEYIGTSAPEATREIIDKIMPLTREILKAEELMQHEQG